MKKMMGMVWSILGLFVFSTLFFLFLNGMLVPKPPFVRAAKGYSAPDSLMAPEPAGEAAAEAQTDDRQGNNDDAPSPEAEVDNGVVQELAQTSLPEDTQSPVPDVAENRSESVEAQPNADTEAADTTETMQAADPTGDAAAATMLEDTDKQPFDPDKMTRLVRVYEKMRPKQVGLILNTMPDAQSVAVLRNMKDRAAAQVMAAMEPAKAARMSQLMVEEGTP